MNFTAFAEILSCENIVKWNMEKHLLRWPLSGRTCRLTRKRLIVFCLIVGLWITKSFITVLSIQVYYEKASEDRERYNKELRDYRKTSMFKEFEGFLLNSNKLKQNSKSKKMWKGSTILISAKKKKFASKQLCEKNRSVLRKKNDENDLEVAIH